MFNDIRRHVSNQMGSMGSIKGVGILEVSLSVVQVYSESLDCGPSVLRRASQRF